MHIILWHFKTIVCLVHKIWHASKSMTNRIKDECRDNPKAICPSNFFEVGGIKIKKWGQLVWQNSKLSVSFENHSVTWLRLRYKQQQQLDLNDLTFLKCIPGSINKLVDKRNNFVVWCNSDFIFQQFLNKSCCMTQHCSLELHLSRKSSNSRSCY